MRQVRSHFVARTISIVLLSLFLAACVGEHQPQLPSSPSKPHLSLEDLGTGPSASDSDILAVVKIRVPDRAGVTSEVSKPVTREMLRAELAKVNRNLNRNTSHQRPPNGPGGSTSVPRLAAMPPNASSGFSADTTVYVDGLAYHLTGTPNGTTYLVTLDGGPGIVAQGAGNWTIAGGVASLNSSVGTLQIPAAGVWTDVSIGPEAITALGGASTPDYQFLEIQGNHQCMAALTGFVAASVFLKYWVDAWPALLPALGAQYFVLLAGYSLYWVSAWYSFVDACFDEE